MPRAIAKIVSLIDTSGSMGGYGYITPAKSDLDTFVNMFQPGDRFAIISFNTYVYRTYPTTANLEVYNPSTSGAASAAIQALSSQDLTNIGDAIIMGDNLLKPESEPRGLVLLSDGDWNRGPDPLTVLDKNIRTYTIALGNNGQLDLLRKIANETGGAYLFTPDAIGLASIYFDILEYSKVGQVVYNARKPLGNQQHFNSVVKLSAGLDSASVAVNWADPSITYAASNPGNNQIAVTVRDPDFQKVPIAPTYRDYGFVVYTLPYPKPGNWYFDTVYVGSKIANVTAGGLDPDLTSTLTLEGPADVVPAGEPFTVRARLAYEGNPVGGGGVAASADVPSVSTAEALAHYDRELASVTLSEDVAATPEARLQALRQARLPRTDILPRHTVLPAVAETAAGEHELTFHTDKPGEYVVRVEAVAPHPRGGELMRTRLLTVSVR
jgi:hypothetical protein